MWCATEDGSAKLTRDARPSVYVAASSSRVIGLNCAFHASAASAMTTPLPSWSGGSASIDLSLA